MTVSDILDLMRDIQESARCYRGDSKITYLTHCLRDMAFSKIREASVGVTADDPSLIEAVGIYYELFRSEEEALVERGVRPLVV